MLSPCGPGRIKKLTLAMALTSTVAAFAPAESSCLAGQTAEGLKQPVHVGFLVGGGKGNPQPR